MANLYVFCTSRELTSWLTRLRAARTLGALTFDERGAPTIVAPDAELDLASERSPFAELCLFPWRLRPTALPNRRDLAPRKHGWMEVRPGGTGLMAGEGPFLFQSALHGEKNAFWKSELEIQWLKRNLKNELIRGVNVAARDHPETTRMEDDLCYSRGAKELFDEGIGWRQLGTRNVVYSP